MVEEASGWHGVVSGVQGGGGETCGGCWRCPFPALLQLEAPSTEKMYLVLYRLWFVLPSYKGQLDFRQWPTPGEKSPQDGDGDRRVSKRF